MTDEERIAKRQTAVHMMGQMKEWRIATVEAEIKLHDECGGTGLLAGSVVTPCTYCAGSGRVIYHTARTVVPFRSL